MLNNMAYVPHIWEVFGVNVGTGKGLTLSAWFTCFTCWCRLAMAEFFVAKFPKIATVSGLHTTPNSREIFEYKGAPEILLWLGISSSYQYINDLLN